MKIFLSIIAVTLFPLAFWICGWAYPDHCSNSDSNMAWWDLRLNLYAIIILLAFWIAIFKTTNKHERFLLSVGIGLSVSDVADRLYFNITQFNKEDVIMIVITLLVAYLECYTRFNVNKLFRK